MRCLCLALIAFGAAIANMFPAAESGRSAPLSAALRASISGSLERPLSTSSEDDFSQTLPSSATAQFDIPAEALSTALLDFGRQAQVSLLLPSRPLEGFVSAPVYGYLSTDDALAQLLRCLPFRARVQDSTLIIVYRDGSALGADPIATPIVCETRAELVT